MNSNEPAIEERLGVLEGKVENHLLNNPLLGYKDEMTVRCKNFDNRIKGNTAETIAVETRLVEKIRGTRAIIGRIIATLIIVGVTITGIFGTLQVDKISRSEFTTQIAASKNIRSEFLEDYKYDRDKRDSKIDQIFEKQLSFNQEMIKQTAILSKQLAVIEARINVIEQN
jgi:hypothetical protein